MTTPLPPEMSEHFKTREPSAIRLAQIEFARRKDPVIPINTAIGNVTLPMHPRMRERLARLAEPGSPFADGVVKYSPTIGEAETRKAVLNVIASSGFPTKGLDAMITDGGSQVMELLVVGLAGKAGSAEKPLLLIDAAYVNYRSFAERCGRATVSIRRSLREDGTYSLPDIAEIERVIEKNRPGAIVVIPYDNPTGQLYSEEMLVELARLCVKHNLWMVSDEAYRELYYIDRPPVSIWGIDDTKVPGIEGRRIGIDTASKVWNACGLRVGALVTDNEEFLRRAVAEYTANLCSNVIGQYIYAALANESHDAMRAWYREQKEYYRAMMSRFWTDLNEQLPGIIISVPHAAIYSVVDVRRIAPPDFDALDFVMTSVRTGAVEIDGKKYTLLVSPMADFYDCPPGTPNPGRTQMRIAFVETPEKMELVPRVFAELFRSYCANRRL